MPLEEHDLPDMMDDFRYLLQNKLDGKLQNIIVSMHPSDIAELVEKLSDDDDRAYLFDLMDAELASETLVELDEVTRERLIERLGNLRVSELVDEMDSDDAAEIVSELADEDREEILKNVEDEDEREVRELLEFAEDSAGRIMALELVTVQENSTVDEAINEIRKKAEEVEEVYNVYVIDDEGRLSGTLSLIHI